MSASTRRLVGFALIAVLTAGIAAPAGADETVDTVIGGLSELSQKVDKATRRAERLMNADWEAPVATAVNVASLDRLEMVLAVARVDAAEVLRPLIGTESTGAVPTAITAVLWNEDMNFLERRDHTDTLDAWHGFRLSVNQATALRDRLRAELGLPKVTGLRVCPLKDSTPFRHDWGEQRGWWRSHKGTDMNAPHGTRLVAMERGEVIQMGWHYLGGNGLYLRGAVTDDVYYYAHLSGYAEGVEVGTPVEPGQVVAYVGDTGNSDVPHLHLGWMPGTGQVDLDALADAYHMLVELCL